MDQSTPKRRILVVDDEPGIRTVLRVKLRLAGFDVTTAATGAEAIELVRAQEPDVVLLDILMPGMTGIDVLQRVRAFSQVPIIMVTARPDMEQVALKHGANGLIAKPFDPDHVVARVWSLLGNAGKKQPGD